MAAWWYFDQWVYVPSTWGNGSPWVLRNQIGPELLHSDQEGRMEASRLSAAGPIGNYTRAFKWTGGQWVVDNTATLPGQAVRYG